MKLIGKVVGGDGGRGNAGRVGGVAECHRLCRSAVCRELGLAFDNACPGFERSRQGLTYSEFGWEGTAGRAVSSG